MTVFLLILYLNIVKGFYKKIEETVNPRTYFISYYIPPYPIKPEFDDDWVYFMRTPFKVAKNKKEWIHAVLGKRGSLDDLERKIRRDFTDYKQKILELNDDIAGVEWSFKKRK